MDEIIINGIIGGWEIDAKEIVKQINNSTKDLKIRLNSVGGSVIDGINIYNALRGYNKGTVTIEIDAAAASIASYIAMAGDKVIANDNSTFMIHNAWMPAVGDFIKLRKAADISEGLSNLIAKAYAKKTGMNEGDIKKLMNAETFYYGEEIKNAGFVDEIKQQNSDTTKAQAMAIAIEQIKACNNAIVEHNQELDFEAVAKLLPKEKEETKMVGVKEVVDKATRQKIMMKIKIHEKEVRC